MKLVPLGDKIVLKQLEAERQQSPESYYRDRQKRNHRKQK